LAAELRLDPLGSLSALKNPWVLDAIKGGGKEDINGREGERREEEKGK